MKAREAAFRVVHEVVYKKGYSNIALEQIIKKGGYEGKDAGFITEITLGTLRNKIFLEHVISNYSNVKIKKISPSAMSALLIGSYQIIFMDRTPDSAACNESVRIASKFAGSRTRGFVNAVLRAIAKDKKPIGGYLEGLEGIDYLSIRYSCSRDAVSKIMGQYGFEMTEKILKGMNNAARTCIRFNNLENDNEKLLVDRGIAFTRGVIASSAYYPKIYGSAASLDLYKEGVISIQDEGAQAMGEFTAPEPGNMVLDACASPGGKTLHLAAIMKNKGRITACDIHPHRVKNMKDNIKRTAFDIIKCIQQNMTVKDDKYIDKFDIVLVDAPCSGLGTAQRRPEIKFQYEADESLYKLQDMILENCADYVKPGGKLIYGTCTLFKEENRDVIERLLSKRDDYEPAGEKMILPDGRSGGFYMAGLARKK